MWLFAIGLIIGGCTGFFVVAMCRSAGNGELIEENAWLKDMLSKKQTKPTKNACHQLQVKQIMQTQNSSAAFRHPDI